MLILLNDGGIVGFPSDALNHHRFFTIDGPQKVPSSKFALKKGKPTP
jgi:hypothetical protein